MGNKFNILYWNIHFMEGSGSSKETLKNSSMIINDIINKYDTQIHAIVFTEAYPQLNNKNNKKYDKYNTLILDQLKDLGYYVYPYDEQKYNSPEKYPYQNEKKCTNGILIASKNKAQLVGIPLIEPNLLGVRIQELGLNLIGVRLFSNYPEHIEKIIEYIDTDKANIIIGDFNMDDDALKQYLNTLSIKLNISKSDLVGTNMSLYIKKDDKTPEFSINNPDKLLYFNCIDSNFVFLETPEQIYCKKEYIDNDMFNKDGSRNSRYGRLNDKICKLGKNENPKKRTAHADINYDIDFIKKEYNKFGIRFPYISSSVCIVPFPDHNLMLASVDLGD